MARPADTYRAARRNAWRKDKLIWREGRRKAGWLAYHASLPLDALAKRMLQKAAA